jgi:sulfide dehydrogenase [flavocytochrome c] flavoprotein chain
MNAFSRRHFLKLLGAASAFAALPPAVRAATTPPRVVIIGGGFAGATLAKYLRLWGGNVDVTLVDPNASHTACILSNLVVTGAISMSRITLSYDSLRTKYGVRVLRDSALAVDPAGHSVSLASGATLPYDRLVLAPGIDFLPIPGWDPNLVPHAWQAGPQTTLLKNQLAAMTAGRPFVLTVPKAPYRCPPGPYERACVVADYVKRKKPGSKVIVLDANASIVAEPHNFGNAFNQTYAGIIEYYTNVTVNQVDSANRMIYTSLGNFSAGVLNVIPDQRAGAIVTNAGLTTDPTGRWAPVSPLSYASTVHGDIHVIGDSQATGQPKSGHMASSQAKVCADAILRAFAGLTPDPAPTTNSACYSPITASTASWLTAAFQYDAASNSMKLVPAAFGEARAPSQDNYQEMFKWADNIFADSYK